MMREVRGFFEVLESVRQPEGVPEGPFTVWRKHEVDDCYEATAISFVSLEDEATVRKHLESHREPENTQVVVVDANRRVVESWKFYGGEWHTSLDGVGAVLKESARTISVKSSSYGRMNWSGQLWSASVVQQVLDAVQEELRATFGKYTWHLDGESGDYQIIAQSMDSSDQWVDGRGKTPKMAILDCNATRSVFQKNGWLPSSGITDEAPGPVKESEGVVHYSDDLTPYSDNQVNVYLMNQETGEKTFETGGTYRQFLQDNDDASEGIPQELLGLEPGKKIEFGGGAAPLFLIYMKPTPPSTGTKLAQTIFGTEGAKARGVYDEAFPTQRRPETQKQWAAQRAKDQKANTADLYKRLRAKQAEDPEGIWAEMADELLAKNPELGRGSRRTYQEGRTHVEDAIEQAKRQAKDSGQDRFVFATAYGYVASLSTPPPGQRYYTVHPDGTVVRPTKERVDLGDGPDFVRFSYTVYSDNQKEIGLVAQAMKSVGVIKVVGQPRQKGDEFALPVEVHIQPGSADPEAEAEKLLKSAVAKAGVQEARVFNRDAHIYTRYDVVHIYKNKIYDHSQGTWDAKLRAVDPAEIETYPSSLYEPGMTAEELRAKARGQKESRETKELDAGLRQWVQDYQVARKAGNIKLAKSIKSNIDKAISEKGLDAKEVYGCCGEARRKPRRMREQESAFKAGDTVTFDGFRRRYVVVAVNKDGTVNMVALEGGLRDSEYKNQDPAGLVKAGNPSRKFVGNFARNLRNRFDAMVDMARQAGLETPMFKAYAVEARRRRRGGKR